jgi:preprotein translocase subunit Sss1
MNNVKAAIGITAIGLWFVGVIVYLLSRPNIWNSL